jgi:outer membrane protein assembly factor BamB
MKILLSLFMTAAFSGCGTLSNFGSKFEAWQTSMQDRKTFQVNEEWVVATPRSFGVSGLGLRKINRMTPVIYKDKSQELIIQGNAIDGIAAYRKNSGYEVWHLDVTNGVEGSAALINDRLFFGGLDGQFYSVEATTGKVLWTFPTRIENLAEPLIDDGVVYFLTGAGSLYALDAATGKQVWLYTRQDPNSLNVRGGSKPALRNGVLFVGFSDGALVALNSKTGAVKWEKQLNNNKKFKDLDTNPLVDNEFIFALGFDDKLYCLRSSTGEMVWKNDSGGFGGMVLVGDRLMYATTNMEFIAVDKNTGARTWTYKLQDGIATSPSLYRGLVTFGESQGSLVFLDSGTGKFVGSFNPGRGIMSTPAVDEKANRAYFISGESNLYSMDIGFKYPKVFSYLR